MDAQSCFLLHSSSRYHGDWIRVVRAMSRWVFKNRLVRMQDCRLEFWSNSSGNCKHACAKGGLFVAVGRRSQSRNDSRLLYGPHRAVGGFLNRKVMNRNDRCLK